MDMSTVASSLLAGVLGNDRAGADQPALTMGKAQLTYGELQSSVHAIAKSLRRLGVEEGDRVALILPKSIAMAELILGILAVGAAYVPLNSKLPPRALSAILGDLEPRLVIAHAPLVESLSRDTGLPGLRAARLAPEAPGRLMEVSAIPAGPPPPKSDPGLAAILYTSGSTGDPKGIMLTHRNMQSFVDWAVGTFAISSTDHIANHAAFHFDLSVFDLFAALFRHATVHLIDETAAQFPGAIRALIDARRISVWYSVPSALVRLQERQALKGAASLRLILFAGEVFPTPALRRLMADVPYPDYANLYGPTETNVCTYYRLPASPASDSEALPIGRASEHLEVSIRDENGEEIADGATGEICVAGPAVMSGYWRKPELTFATRLAGRSDSYRTVDYGYRRADGLLMLTGRRDQQVKLRGYRIELLALEAELNAHPALREAVALVVPDERTGGELLVYAVAKDKPLEISEIRRFVSERLAPAYQPDRIQWMNEMPRTANGKCDRAFLRSSAQHAVSS